MRLRASTLILAGLLAACGAAPGNQPLASDPSGAPPPGLDGRTFLSISRTTSGADSPFVPGTVMRLSFDAGGRLGVSAGCNSIGGDYRIDGTTLRFTGGSMTEMGCDDPRHAQDDWLGTFLAAGPTVSLNGNDLTLTAGDTTIKLVDRRIAQPDLPLVETRWALSSIGTGNTVSSVPDLLAVPTITFHEDGGVDVFTGCNTGSGRFTADAAGMRISNVTLTKRACADQAGGRLEAAILTALQADRVAWEIDEANLTLQAGGQLLGFVGR